MSELRLQVDASKHRLGAALLQEGQSIGYTSGSLSDSEVSYVQIENEIYAIYTLIYPIYTPSLSNQ